MVTSNPTNSAALASPIYNPNIDETSLKLFNIMNTGYPDDLVEQYRQMITSLPTSNAYSTLLTNPQACNISQAQTSIGNVQAGLTQQYNSVVAQGTPVGTYVGSVYTPPAASGATSSGTVGTPGYSPSTTQVATLNTWQSSYPAMMANISQTTQTLGDFQTHTDRTIANFPSIFGMVQSALGIATVVGGLLNPCLGLTDFLGSLLSKGSSIMNKINAGIAMVEAAIGAALAEVEAAIAYVMGLVQSLIALVEAEILKLIKSLIDAARLGLAQLLNLLPQDPCFKSVLSTIGTGALLGTLASV